MGSSIRSNWKPSSAHFLKQMSNLKCQNKALLGNWLGGSNWGSGGHLLESVAKKRIVKVLAPYNNIFCVSPRGAIFPAGPDLASPVSIWYAYYISKLPSWYHLVTISFWNPYDNDSRRNSSTIFSFNESVWLENLKCLFRIIIGEKVTFKSFNLR